MKKTLLLLLCIITIVFLPTNYINAEEKQREMDHTWEKHIEHTTLRVTENSSDINNHVYKIGWYIFNFDASYAMKYFGIYFQEFEIIDEMYIPILRDQVVRKVYYIDDYYTCNGSQSMELMNHFKQAEVKIEGDTLAYFSEEYPIDNLPPNFTTNEVTTYTSDRETINEIKKRIYAFDIVDGDVSHNIAILKESYSHDQTPGIKEVDLQVNDSKGNIAYHTVEILVIDNFTSTITSNDIYTTTSNLLEQKVILDNIYAFDHLGVEFNVTIDVSSYEENYNISGTYDVLVTGNDDHGNTIYHTLNIIVLNSKYSFYSVDNVTLYFNDYISLSNDELIILLDTVSNNNYKYTQYEVDSKIKETIGTHYIFYKLFNNEEIIEVRLSVHFSNIEQIEIQTENELFNIGEYIAPITSCIAILLLMIHMISHAVEKRK